MSNLSRRMYIAMTTSSSAVLPARSPIPFTGTSTWRAPPRTPARVFAVAIPRSLWQWQLRMAVSIFGTLFMIPCMSKKYSFG